MKPDVAADEPQKPVTDANLMSASDNMVMEVAGIYRIEVTKVSSH